jgi:hypothetical protein
MRDGLKRTCAASNSSDSRVVGRTMAEPRKTAFRPPGAEWKLQDAKARFSELVQSEPKAKQKTGGNVPFPPGPPS